MLKNISMYRWKMKRYFLIPYLHVWTNKWITLRDTIKKNCIIADNIIYYSILIYNIILKINEYAVRAIPYYKSMYINNNNILWKISYWAVIKSTPVNYILYNFEVDILENLYYIIIMWENNITFLFFRIFLYNYYITFIASKLLSILVSKYDIN